MGLISRLRRIFADQPGQGARTKYAAAKTSDGWAPTNQDPNTIIAASSPAVRAKVRQLVRDFPLFRRAVQILVDTTVGDGISLQAAATTPDGEPNEKLNTAIEQAWARWCEEAHAGGTLHMTEIEQMAIRQEAETGEFLLVRTRLNRPGRLLPLAFQMYEADWLTCVGASPQSRTNTIEQGIEINTLTGERVAYWFEDPNSWGRPIRVAAADVLHGYQMLRPGQLRGISPFACAVMLAGSLAEYITAEVDGAKSAARYLAFITSPDLADFQNLREAKTGDIGQRIEEMESATIEYLRPGEEIKLANSNRPNNGVEPFTALLARWIAVSVDVTYERLTGDYKGINYSNLRGIRNDEMQQARPRQGRLIRQLCTPVYRMFLDELAMRGGVLPPDYWQNRLRYQQCTMLPPGLEAVDALRETKANLQQIKAGLRSPRETVRARGRDLDTVLSEIAADMKLASEKYGLTLDMDGGAPLAQNPASLGATDK